MFKLYKCSKCKSMVIKINKGGCDPSCCGQMMDLCEPGTVDAAREKHVPVATVEGNLVRVAVGSVAHPMTEEHYISLIILETDKGFQLKNLTPEDKPEACFAVAPGETAVAVYEFCTLHGFWKTEI